MKGENQIAIAGAALVGIVLVVALFGVLLTNQTPIQPTNPTPAPAPNPATPTPANPSPIADTPDLTEVVEIRPSRFVAYETQTNEIEIKKGGTVKWINADLGSEHTVTADNGAFNSGEISTGLDFSHTFNTSGTFTYRCSLHPEMTGRVVVVD